MTLLGIVLSFASPGQATTVKPKPVKDTVAPKLQVKFGPYADSAKVPASVIKQIIKSELKITDTKGTVYNLIGFSFSWKRKDITDDFKTGIPKTIYLYNSVDVKSDSHIPASWQDEIKGNVQAKEELRFDEILVQSVKTKTLYKTGPVTLFVL
jgi:hypothetical protein